MPVTATLGSPTLTSAGNDKWNVVVPVTYSDGTEEAVSAQVNASKTGARQEFARILQEQIEARIVVLERKAQLEPVAALVVSDVQAALGGGN